MTKPKPKKRYATLKFRDNFYNGRLVAVNDNATEYPLLSVKQRNDRIILAEFVEGTAKGTAVAVRLANLTWCES